MRKFLKPTNPRTRGPAPPVSRAALMGIHVVRAFVQLRDLLASNKELAQKFAELEPKVSSHDQAITRASASQWPISQTRYLNDRQS